MHRVADVAAPTVLVSAAFRWLTCMRGAIALWPRLIAAIANFTNDTLMHLPSRISTTRRVVRLFAVRA